MNVHHLRRLVVAVALALAVATTPAVPASAVGASTSSGAAGTDARAVTWGIAGLNTQSSVQGLETTIGRQFGAVRVFLLWDQAFPTPFHHWLATTGRRPLISVKASRTDGSPIRWHDIAVAPPGSPLYTQLVGWADRIKAYGVPVYFTFNHEPEATASLTSGTSADYVAAYQRVFTVFGQRGVTNAKFMWILTANAFRVPVSDPRYAPKWFPGPTYVTAIATDIYNDFTCRSDSNSPWMDLTFETEQFRLFSAQYPTKEMWIAEWASVEDPATPGRKATWINKVRSDLKDPRYAQLRGLLYFSRFRKGTNCTWFVNSSSSALAAFTAMGQDPFYQGHTP